MKSLEIAGASYSNRRSNGISAELSAYASGEQHVKIAIGQDYGIKNFSVPLNASQALRLGVWLVKAAYTPKKVEAMKGEPHDRRCREDVAMTDDDYWAAVRRELAELEERYERISQAWANSEIPQFVRDTPDWQSGWKIVQDWVYRHATRLGWPNASAPLQASTRAVWCHEVHIMSHMFNEGGGHSAKHAAIEEEGTRLVLEWWNALQEQPKPT
jgi:hypothetical protein